MDGSVAEPMLWVVGNNQISVQSIEIGLTGTELRNISSKILLLPLWLWFLKKLHNFLENFFKLCLCLVKRIPHGKKDATFFKIGNQNYDKNFIPVVRVVSPSWCKQISELVPRMANLSGKGKAASREEMFVYRVILLNKEQAVLGVTELENVQCHGGRHHQEVL